MKDFLVCFYFILYFEINEVSILLFPVKSYFKPFFFFFFTPIGKHSLYFAYFPYLLLTSFCRNERLVLTRTSGHSQVLHYSFAYIRSDYFFVSPNIYIHTYFSISMLH